MTSMTQPIDAQRLTLILNDLRLPAIKHPRRAGFAWPDAVIGRALSGDKEGWPATSPLPAPQASPMATRSPTRSRGCAR